MADISCLPATQAEYEAAQAAYLASLTPAQAEWEAAYQRSADIPEDEQCGKCQGMGGWLAFTPAGEELFRRCEPCKATGRKATAA